MKLRRFAALAGAFLLTFGVVSSVFADAANPDTIHASVSGTTVTLNGNWSWSSHGNKCDDRWVGWAVDWDDPASAGNPVANTGFHVGTPTDNAVHTNKDCGTIGAAPNDFPSGTWGDISHTYAAAGTYHVCVLTYDIHLGKDGQPNKDSELVAGGSSNSDHNKDNSAETNGQDPAGNPGVDCIPADIVIPHAPAINVVKTPSTTALPVGGGSVTYTYVVTNTGDVPLTDVTLADDKCSGGTGPTGDTNDDQILQTTETWTYTCTMTLTASTTNTATATGHDGDTPVTDTDKATVTVATPSSSVAGETNVPKTAVPKTAPPTDTLTTTTTDAGGTLPLLLIVLGVIGLGAVVLTPRRAKKG